MTDILQRGQLTYPVCSVPIAVADTVTAAGVQCSPYAPDSLMAPAAYVNAIRRPFGDQSGLRAYPATCVICRRSLPSGRTV